MKYNTKTFEYMVVLKHWVIGSGFTHEELFEHGEIINDDTCFTAEEYARDFDGDIRDLVFGDAISIEVRDADNNVLSEYWVEK